MTFPSHPLIDEMLSILTSILDLFAMAASLWLAFYLFARGYPNRVTMRTVLVLLALSVYFLGAYNNFFQPTSGGAALCAAMLILGMACWHDATFHLLPADQQAQLRWLKNGVYLLSAGVIILLVTNPASFTLKHEAAFLLYAGTIFLINILLLFNLWINRRARLSAQGRFLLLASFLPWMLSIQNILSMLTDRELMPRLAQDLLIFIGVFLLGISVARYQSMMERRTILDEFPLTAAIVSTMAFLYGLIGIFGAFPISALGNVTTSLIMTIGFYDLGREALDRRHTQSRSRFRRKLRTFDYEGNKEDKLLRLLQEGLDLLCETLHASAGMVAVCRSGKTIVMASRNSVGVGGEFIIEDRMDEELWRSRGQIQNIEWLSSILEGPREIALAGLGPSQTKLEYSKSDLELFAEFADHAGTIISISNLLPAVNINIRESMEESHAQSTTLNLAAEDMLDTLSGTEEQEVVKMIEEALRKFSDFIALGQSPLADWMGIDGETHIERGKRLQSLLRGAVEILRPAGIRPVDPISRSWYSYIVLHDAYLEGHPNRDVMARLFISEATFHRTRRRALRGLARGMVDKLEESEKRN